ncbi:MAG: hypothetical protein AAGI17_04170 [Planctomycetota bacterium]
MRTGHATTTLVRTVSDDDERRPINLLIDPGLPEPVLLARLRERANLGPEDITDVFLTTFQPECRRSLAAFERANWLISNDEREAVGVPLAEGLKRLVTNFDDPDNDTEAVLRADIALLQRCQPAPDRLGVGVDLFPLGGVTPGCCGLLLAGRETVLVCGDAIPTSEHLDEGKVLPNCADTDQAQASFREAVEIADLLILGRDNLATNPLRRAF